MCFLFIPKQLSAQQTESIKGKIVDSQTMEPLPFVTIRLKNKMIGVISNADGSFQLPDRYKSIADTIIISCIGYTHERVSLSELTEALNIIKLKSSSVQLAEVEIKANRKGRLTAPKIVKTAIENIPANYSFNPFGYVGYYRDYQIEDNQYVNLNEALVQIFDQGFNRSDYDETKIKLLTYKRNLDFSIDSTASINYDNGEKKFIPQARIYSFGGNELSILRIHDAIRNNNVFTYSFVGKFNSDFVYNHDFKIKNVVFLNDVPLYCITFNSKTAASGEKHFSTGKIYIEKGNFAIHKLEYATFERSEGEKHLLYDIQLEYARNNALMFLNYISFNNFFKMRNATDLKVLDVAILKPIYGFKIRFSNPLEESSARDKRNYYFKVGEKKLEIVDILLREKNTEVWVKIKSDKDFNVDEDPLTLIPKVKVDIKRVMDTQGREVNAITFKEVNQFRELFVQQVEEKPTLSPDSSVFIDKKIPLSENTQLFVPNHLDYWMNSPLKTLSVTNDEQ